MNQAQAAERRRAIIAGVAGNVMEWYDFTVYGYFAAVIGRQFFPSDDPLSSLLAAFGVFAAGFLMRPFGSLVFGHIGDKHGRRVALVLSVALMAVPTVLMGLLPTYQQIGIAASVALVALRMIQGLSVGGECGTSIIFLVEQAGIGERGAVGSWASFGSCGGILLGSAVGALITTMLDHGAVEAWGWRLPFLFGIVVGACGLYIRRRLGADAPMAAGPRPQRSPVKEALLTEWRSILTLVGLNAGSAIGFYLCFVYVTTYLRQTDHLAASKALDINTIAIVVLLALIPPAGRLSDRIGRKPVLLGATIGLFVLAWPMFWLMHHPDVRLILVGQVSFAVLVALFTGTMPSAMAELAPPHLRCTVLSLGMNLGFGVLGGLTPLVAVYAIKRSHNDLSPAFVLMAAAAVSFGVLASLRETYRRPFAGAVPAGVAGD
jgi:MHS family proline/betaine transporter-like MFS transporter